MRIAALLLTARQHPGDYNRALLPKATKAGQTVRSVAGHTQAARTSAVSVSGGGGSGLDAFRGKRSGASRINQRFHYSRDAGPLLITQNGGLLRLRESCHNGC